MGEIRIKKVTSPRTAPATPTWRGKRSNPASSPPVFASEAKQSRIRPRPTPEIEPVPISASEAQPPRWLVVLLQVLAYGIPLSFLAYVLYINYLPFGYDKTFTIDVGAEGDTDSSQPFYLEPSPDLSERKVAEDGTTYRELDGIVYAVFEPSVVLKDAEITVSVEGEGVSIIPPVIDFNPDDYEWDYEWDFTNEETAFQTKISEEARKRDWTRCTTDTNTLAEWLDLGGTIVSTSSVVASSSEMGTGSISEDNEEFVPVPISEATTTASTTVTTTEHCVTLPVPDLEGSVFLFNDDRYTHFDGYSTRVELPDSSDLFEETSFTLFAEWKPQDSKKNSQQIIGHYNWELFQNSRSVTFQFGRINDDTAMIYQIKHPITPEFFLKKHSALIVVDNSFKGNVQFYIDNQLVSSIPITAPLNEKYGNSNLSFGQSEHGKANHFEGQLYSTKILSSMVSKRNTNVTLNYSGTESLSIPINGFESLEDINLRVTS